MSPIRWSVARPQLLQGHMTGGPLSPDVPPVLPGALWPVPAHLPPLYPRGPNAESLVSFSLFLSPVDFIQAPSGQSPA